MKLSIAIPVYNAAGTVCRSLDSIYSQGLDPQEFEVICVDNCSSDNSVEVLEGYRYKGNHPANMQVVRHSVNKGPGGNRNTGIKTAKGKWLLFLDADDLFVGGGNLKKLLAVADAEPELDTIMFDICRGDGEGNLFRTDTYTPMHLDTRTMTGPEFLQEIPVPYTPWNYMYRRDHLLSTGVFFAEFERLEDTDFVLRHTAQSKAIRFVPLVVYYYTLWPGQATSVMSADVIRGFFHMNKRLFDAAIAERERSYVASEALMRHTIYYYRAHVSRFYWRLPSYKDIRQCLAEGRFTAPTGDRLVDFCNRHVTLTAVVLTLCKPALTVAAWMMKKMKKR